jgi:hypothetical protein
VLRAGLVCVPRDALEHTLARAEELLVLDHRIEAALKGVQSFAAATSTVGYL